MPVVKTIFKFELTDRLWLQYVDLKRGVSWVKPLAVQYQEDRLCLWAMVEVDARVNGQWKARVPVYIVGTGHPVPDRVEVEYAGTVQSGEFVWHLFTGKPQFNRIEGGGGGLPELGKRSSEVAA